MEQPELGSDSVAPDSVTFTLSWHWEAGWRGVASRRLSGSDSFGRLEIGEGLDAAELHARVTDVLAEVLGLI